MLFQVRGQLGTTAASVRLNRILIKNRAARKTYDRPHICRLDPFFLQLLLEFQSSTIICFCCERKIISCKSSLIGCFFKCVELKRFPDFALSPTANPLVFGQNGQAQKWHSF